MNLPAPVGPARLPANVVLWAKGLRKTFRPRFTGSG